MTTSAPHSSRIHPDTARAVKLAHFFGYRVVDICKETELSRDSVSRIVNGKTHKRVQLTAYEQAMFRSLSDLFSRVPTPKREREQRERLERQRNNPESIIDRFARARRRPGR